MGRVPPPLVACTVPLRRSPMAAGVGHRRLAGGTQALLPRRDRGRSSPEEVETALRAYEVMVILDPSLEERTIAPSLEKYLGVVTKDGEIIYPDRQLMLFAADVLSRVPGGQIIYDVKCTRLLAPWIRQHGGEPLMWNTGHALVKAKLKETGAPLAGEMSGHTFFKERWYGFDDGLYTGARLLEILSRSADANAPLKSKLRHYTKLDAMAGKLKRLISDFKWDRLDRIVEQEKAKLA